MIISKLFCILYLFFHVIFLETYFLLYFTKVSIHDGLEIEKQPPPSPPVHHLRGFKCWDQVLPEIPLLLRGQDPLKRMHIGLQ